MRILFVASWYPFPPDNGARARTYNLLKALASCHEVSLLSFYDGSRPPDASRLDAMRSCCRTVDVVPRLPYRGHSLSSVREVVCGRPPWVTLRWNPFMGERVRSVCRPGSVDLVIISQVQNLPLVDDLAAPPPLLLEQFEIGRIWDRVQARHGPARLRASLSRCLWTSYLHRHLPRLAAITVPTVAEQEILGGIVRQRRGRPVAYRRTGDSQDGGAVHGRSGPIIELIPNGVDLEHNCLALREPEPGMLVYSGSLEVGANYDAVLHFVEDILPLLERSCPSVRLRVTGGCQGVDTAPLLRRGHVELTGRLPDVRPAVASSWACVVPLRHGSGSRLKVLEAMALGTPVVSTPKGLEGIDAVHGEHALIADDAAQFAQSVAEVLTDGQLRARLAANARRLVERKHDWIEIGARLSALCEQVGAAPIDRRCGDLLQATQAGRRASL